jgi:calcineurin-like phosphoesterase family protein
MHYFTSDLHFFHQNIIKHSHRPFSSLEEMEVLLINNWNSVVTKSDIVYVLGDVAFLTYGRKIEDLEKILKMLNGQKFLVKGNHDNKKIIDLNVWIHTYVIKSIKIYGQSIALCHYPMMSWNSIHHGAWHLHGHCHGNLKTSHGKMYDVGVDTNNFTPISFDQIKKIMDEKKYTVVDHHIPDDSEE